MSSDGLVQGVDTKPSRYTIAETLERLEKVIRSKGLTIFALIDHSGEAERAGLRMRDAKLLIFGSPKTGTPLMIASPLLALDLPLKALVWKDKRGPSIGKLDSVKLSSAPQFHSPVCFNCAFQPSSVQSSVDEGCS